MKSLQRQLANLSVIIPVMAVVQNAIFSSRFKVRVSQEINDSLLFNAVSHRQAFAQGKNANVIFEEGGRERFANHNGLQSS